MMETGIKRMPIRVEMDLAKAAPIIAMHQPPRIGGQLRDQDNRTPFQ
jgi:hypothetical protein